MINLKKKSIQEIEMTLKMWDRLKHLYTLVIPIVFMFMIFRYLFVPFHSVDMISFMLLAIMFVLPYFTEIYMKSELMERRLLKISNAKKK